MFKSEEEKRIYGWLLELKEGGFVDEFVYEPLTLCLADKRTVKWNKQLKTKVKESETMISRSVTYTPDFIVYWNTKKSDGILTYDSKGSYTKLPFFYLEEGCCVSMIEVKGSFDRLGTSRDTKTKMVWAEDKFGLHIELVKPKALFAKTFYPEIYLLNDSLSDDRKQRKNGQLVPLRNSVKTIKDYT